MRQFRKGFQKILGQAQLLKRGQWFLLTCLIAASISAVYPQAPLLAASEIPPFKNASPQQLPSPDHNKRMQAPTALTATPNTWGEAASSEPLISQISFTPHFPDKTWWEQFQDPILNSYMQEALANNQNLKAATLRVQEADALVWQIRANQFPKASIQADFNLQKNSKNLTTPSQQQFTQAGPRFFAPGQTVNIYNIPLRASYELDYLLKNARATQAEKQQVQISELNKRSLWITLSTDLAAAYFNLVQTDRLIELQSETLNQLKVQIALATTRYRAGLNSYAEVLTLESRLKAQEPLLVTLQQSQGQYARQLLVLMGKPPHQQAAFVKRASWQSLVKPSQIPVGIPSELILRRPDILASEAALKRAQLNIALARKAFFPSLTLTGSYGLASTQLKNLFSWDSILASAGASLVQNLFTGGSTWFTYKSRKYAYQAQLQDYQGTLFTAFKETEDAIATLKAEALSEILSEENLMTNQDQLSLLKVRAEQGLIAPADFMDQEITLLENEQEVIRHTHAKLIGMLSVYKAVGGGF